MFLKESALDFFPSSEYWITEHSPPHSSIVKEIMIAMCIALKV